MLGRRVGRAVAVLVAVGAMAGAEIGRSPARATTGATLTMSAPYSSSVAGGACQVGSVPAACGIAGGADPATGVIDPSVRVDAPTPGAALRTYRAGIVATHQLSSPARAIDYEVHLRVDRAAANDGTVARTGDALVSYGVEVDAPDCTGRCGMTNVSNDGPQYLATDLDGMNASQLAFSLWYKQPGVTSTANRDITIRFRYQRWNGTPIQPGTVRVTVPVEAAAIVGDYEASMVNRVYAWTPDVGSATAGARVTVTSISATPVS